MDKSALVGYTRKGSVLVILMALLSAMFAIQAVADAPDPTLPFSASVVVDPVSGNSTLTLSGAWAWTTHERDCNEDRFGVGWAVDWNDPGQAGNNLNNTGVFVGSAAAGLNPADNSVHYYDDLPRCGVYNGTYNTGQWGPMTHVYSPNQTSFSVCVVTYDLHFDGNDSDDVKPNDLIAAAIAPAKYNKDNSVEKNGQTPLGNGCFELSVPTLSTTATGSVNLGQPIQDVATLSGATTEPRATGDITFNLYGPDNATCSGAPIFTTSKSVDGNGAYTSNPFTPTVVGTYRWVASYSGDYNAESHKGNAATSGSCNDPGESSVVNAATATITIKKVDNSTPPVPTDGAVYGLYDTLAKASAVAGQADAVAIAAAVTTCTTASSAGTCSLGPVPASMNYWITEVTPPAGLLPSAEIRAVPAASIPAGATLILSAVPFVNDVPVGNVTITKRLFNDENDSDDLDGNEEVTPDNPQDLDGIVFMLQQGDEPSTTHPGGDPATCTIEDGEGECTIYSMRLGTYQVVETLNPSGPDGIQVGTSPSVTITENGETVEVNYDNPLSPLNISLSKVGDKGSASIGETVGYTFSVSTSGPRLHDVSLAEWAGVEGGVTYADICDASPVFDEAASTGWADGFLSMGDLFVWKCSHVVMGTDPNPLPNRAQASGTDDVGRQVEAFDIFNVEILNPDIAITKVADDAVVDAGSDIGFTMEVSNAGPGIARGVTLNDLLPGGDGISWSIESGDDSCEVTGSPGSQVLACGPKDLSDGASFSVQVVSGTQPAGESCSPATLHNTAVADATNDAEVEDSASVEVQCPDIAITKVADDAVVDAGSDIGFTMEVSNAGPGIARGVTLNDPLPNGVEWTIESSTEGANCRIAELDVLTCGAVDLPAGGSFTVHIVADTSAIPEVCGQYDNEATVSLSNGAGDSAEASTEVVCPLAIALEKDGPALAHRGDEITYSFVVANTGQVDLVTVNLSDPNCDEGTLVRVSDGDGDGTLAPGETWGYECTRVISDVDPDPLPNTAAVVGVDERDRSTEATADHEVDLISPVIDIDKSVDDLLPEVGQTVTFTYVVTNTGDTTLFDVDVVDDVLGPVGVIAELAVGDSATFTLTDVVSNASRVNVGTAEGEDILGKSVTDSDTVEIAVVEDVVIVPVDPVTTLPRTGGALARSVEVALLLLLGGAILVRSGRGRRELTAQDD